VDSLQNELTEAHAQVEQWKQEKQTIENAWAAQLIKWKEQLDSKANNIPFIHSNISQ
jgi:hypothetical protein